MLTFLLWVLLPLSPRPSEKSWFLFGALIPLPHSWVLFCMEGGKQNLLINKKCVPTALKITPLTLHFFNSVSPVISPVLSTNYIQKSLKQIPGEQWGRTHRQIWKVTTFIACPAFWGPHIPSPLIKTEIPSRVWIWFHPWECVGRLALGLNKMKSSALSPLPFGSPHALTFFFLRNGVILEWVFGVKMEYFGKKQLPHFCFPCWREAMARAIFSGDRFLKRHEVITENLVTCAKVSPWKLSVMSKPDLGVNWWGLQTHALLK